MRAADRLGLLLAIPGLLLAFSVFSYLLLARLVCDPLYQENKLLDWEFFATINPKLADKLRGSFAPPPRDGIAFYEDRPSGTYCRAR